ncbi:MAG: hypothetical protein J6D07_01690 [Mogibacterium sp.]|nr:hypothetical protein [Mogibacterium sp.]
MQLWIIDAGPWINTWTAARYVAAHMFTHSPATADSDGRLSTACTAATARAGAVMRIIILLLSPGGMFVVEAVDFVDK